MAVQAVAVGSVMHSFTDVRSDIAVAYQHTIIILAIIYIKAKCDAEV